MPDSWISTIALLLIIAALLILARLDIMRVLMRHPAVVLCAAIATGALYRIAGLPVAEPALVKAFADIGLAGLAFASGIYIRLGRLRFISPESLKLAFIGAPLFLLICALSVFILLPSLSIWAAIFIGTCFMLDGALIDRQSILSAPAPQAVKRVVSLESAVLLVFSLPIIIFLETFLSGPSMVGTGSALFLLLGSGLFTGLIGFVIGGILALLAGRYLKGKNKKLLIWGALLLTALTYCLTILAHGSIILAGLGAGLILAEEAKLSGKIRHLLREQIEEILTPSALILFGFALGPRIFDAGLLVFVFAIAATTFLRFIPRLVALQGSKIDKEDHHFIAWFGGAPGAASALYLLHLLGLAALPDQERVLTIGASVIVLSIITTRLSTRPLVNWFIQQAAISRKRRYFS
ncbi:MAG: cation:proton antiporter domain-containing protein [bacterium]